MTQQPIPDRLDGTQSTESTSATCRHCRHLHPSGRSCAAFPAGIPDPIWWAYRGHRDPYPGDRGIQYEERPLPEPLDARRYDIPEFLRGKPHGENP